MLIFFLEGVATQQVITIPVSQLAGNQIVQLVASNGQIFTTTLASLQAMSQPVPVPGISNPSKWILEKNEKLKINSLCSCLFFVFNIHLYPLDIHLKN